MRGLKAYLTPPNPLKPLHLPFQKKHIKRLIKPPTPSPLLPSPPPSKQASKDWT